MPNKRAEYKRRRTVAIRKLREAGLSEEEIQDALAQIRSELGVSGEESEGQDSVANLPAVIDSAEEARTKRDKKRHWPKKPNRDENFRSTDKEKVAQYDSMLANNPERRCVGTNQLGEPCRNFAIRGGRVCKFHGGATRHVKDAARVRLEMASNRLVGKLVDIAFDDTKPAAVQLDAIKDSLNRAGIVKPTLIEVGPLTPQEEIFSDIMSGSRSDYRNGVDKQEHSHLDDLYASGEVAYKDYSGPFDPEDIAGQSDSGTFDPHTATPDSRPERERTRPPRDSDPPSARRSDEQRSGNRQAQGEHVTGDRAYELANRVNAQIGALRALPPGRSDRD